MQKEEYIFYWSIKKVVNMQDINHYQKLMCKAVERLVDRDDLKEL